MSRSSTLVLSLRIVLMRLLRLISRSRLILSILLIRRPFKLKIGRVIVIRVLLLFLLLRWRLLSVVLIWRRGFGCRVVLLSVILRIRRLRRLLLVIRILVRLRRRMRFWRVLSRCLFLLVSFVLSRLIMFLLSRLVVRFDGRLLWCMLYVVSGFWFCVGASACLGRLEGEVVSGAWVDEFAGE